MSALAERVASAERWLRAIYRLDVSLRAADCLVTPERARRLLPARSPRTGVLVLEEEGAVQVGLYVDPADAGDGDAIVEETSHLLCLAWHAERDRPVSRLHLELQAEVDRYAVARASGRDPLGHFRAFRWAGWMDRAERSRYQAAHRAAGRYCCALEARFPHRADTPAWLAELRRYYRAPAESKLRPAA